MKNFLSIPKYPVEENVRQDPVYVILLCLTYKQSVSEVDAYVF